MADHRLLTDRFLRSLPPAPQGQRVEVWDSVLRGFGVRISATKDADPARRGKAGLISFVLNARFSTGSAPTRRTIGVYGALSLEEARNIAGQWKSSIAKGIDPGSAREAAACGAAARSRHSFSAVAETFIADKLSHERRGKKVERDLRKNLITAWGDRPLSSITPLDVLEVINAKKRSAPGMARALLVLTKRMFNWCCDQHILDRSPCDRLKVTKLIGQLPPRSRRLTDIEIAAFWRATGRMSYPTGPLFRLLLLTGLRLNEAARLSWAEIQNDLITVPASRMKGKDGGARDHLVPLSSMAQEVIALVPRYRGAQYVFSYDGGQRPLQVSSAHKRALDARMLRSLRALARQRGEDCRSVTLPGWVTHDLRRNVRSGLAALRVPFNVCEAVLAHSPPGIVGTYDQHEYLSEKAEALELWAQRISSIVNPPPSNVVALRARQ